MSNVAAPNTSDHSFDLSLRLLTALVLVTLAGSVSFLAYRWLAPRFSQISNEPVAAKISAPTTAPPAKVDGAGHGDQVLMDPGRVFRCEEQGRVLFSDQACPNAAPGARPRAAAGAR